MTTRDKRPHIPSIKHSPRAVHIDGAIISIPEGWGRVDPYKGRVKRGDKRLDYDARAWAKVRPQDIGNSTLVYIAIIRRIPNSQNVKPQKEQA